MSTDLENAVAAPEAPEAPTPETPDAQSETRGRPKMNKTAYREKDAPLLTEWPADYDKSKHKPLNAEDFEKEDVYWDHKAGEYEEKVKKCRQNAEMFRQFGSSEKRKMAEAAVKLHQKTLALVAELQESGIDVSTLDIDFEKLGIKS